MKWIFCFIVPVICVVGAILMALADKSGWGWLLLVALITFEVPSDSDKE